MKYLIPIIITVAFLAAFLVSLWPAQSAKPLRRLRLCAFHTVAQIFSAPPAWRTANAETAAGTHKTLTRRADGAFSLTHLLVKTGSDNFHATIAGSADYPIGSTTDSPDNAEDIFQVHPLNITDHTRRLRCATALAADIDVYSAANGLVQAEPATAGVYYLVGRTAALAVQETSGNYVVEVAPRAPVKLTVIAAATGTAATDIASIFTAIATPTLLKHA